jgi:hypothetical protein
MPSALPADPTQWGESARSELIEQIVVGKLDVAAACFRHDVAEELLLDWLRAFRRDTVLAFDERLRQRLIGQGVRASAFGGAELSGTLSELSVADVLQMIELTGKSAVLRVTHDGAESSIWCADGGIADAVSGRLQGEAAVYRILSLERGHFVAELRASERERRVHACTPALLLEAARRKDESVALWQELGDERRCYELGPRVAEAGGSPSDEEVQLLALFTPHCSLREALAQSELGDFETLTLLRRLIAEGWLVDMGLSAEASESAPRQSIVRWRGEPAPQPAGLRWALTAFGARMLSPAASWIGSRLAAREP